MQSTFLSSESSQYRGSTVELVCSGEGCHIDPALALVNHAVLGSFTAYNLMQLEQGAVTVCAPLN